MKNLIFVAFVFVFTLIACKKGDTTGPVISLEHPMETDTFMNGDTMEIHGSATDADSDLHGVEITITDLTNNVEELTLHEHTDQPTYHFMTEYVVSVPMHSNIEVKVEAEDEVGNTTTITRVFHIMN